jgi:hypothetical protein
VGYWTFDSKNQLGTDASSLRCPDEAQIDGDC